MNGGIALAILLAIPVAISLVVGLIVGLIAGSGDRTPEDRRRRQNKGFLIGSLITLASIGLLVGFCIAALSSGSA